MAQTRPHPFDSSISDLEAIDSLGRSSKLESPGSQSQWPQDYHNEAVTQSQGKFHGKERKKEGRQREMRSRIRASREEETARESAAGDRVGGETEPGSK
ncbi:hypothetical protein M0R45_006402 [Rubus argutus]|uniref:Uncharacterized protein n=1 Tax=Rubus argutus TaxID=59490 RepID=A0AAW1YQU7_RUBAR